VLGVTVAVLLFAPSDVSPARLCCLLMGPAMWLSGRYDEARRRRIDAEVERARNEWPELQRELAVASRMQLDVQRLLAERGYAEATVRRWIAWHLGGERNTR
jgi:hypothetical protein